MVGSQRVSSDEIVTCLSMLPSMATKAVTSFWVEATGRRTVLWPANGYMHLIRPEDCVDVEDVCDGDVRVTFLWITSDEPDDATGDGFLAEDVRDFGEFGVQLDAVTSRSAANTFTCLTRSASRWTRNCLLRGLELPFARASAI